MTRVAWVTGAGKGIGAAIAQAIGNTGIKVALSARTQTDIDSLAAAINNRGGEALAVVCDVTQPTAVAEAASRIEQSLGPITILVNNAGAADSHKFIGHDDALWHKMIDTNLNSVYYVTKAVVPMMAAANRGRIVNIASIAAKVGAKYVAAYTASKHGVLGLTRALALEFVSNNITVNAVCPGYVDTPMTDRAVANITARTRLGKTEARAALEKASPQNRLVTPEEVAHVVMMLIDENARGITGQAINVDGGTVMF